METTPRAPSNIIKALLLLSLHCLLGPAIMAQQTSISTDQASLLALKQHITNDPQDFLSTNWTETTSICNWAGITCGVTHRRVTSLNLAFMDLTGTLPPQLGNLSFLAYFNITNNTFHGSLPGDLSRLRRLQYFSVRHNAFEGEIPQWLPSLLRLKYLFLNGNDFSGTIPESICNVSTLQKLDLSANRLTGLVPPLIFNISSLKMIDLSNNQLSGLMPSSIFRASPLLDIDLASNNLSGDLPRNICGNFPNLQGLFLSYNQFSGEIPSSLSECKQLQLLSLSANNFSGTIPRELGNLTMLTGLYLGANNLIGEIPPEIGNLQNLQVLSLTNNSLSGPIPWAIFNISTIQVITMTLNHLTGTLPSSIGFSMPNLMQLFLGGNILTGPIPSSLSNCSQLTSLDLPQNFFSGSIPSSLGRLKYLQWFSLAGNNLTSEPSSDGLSIITALGNCRYLRRIDLQENKLNAFLPSSIRNLSSNLEWLSIGNSKLIGSIPSEVGNLSGLTLLNFGDNELTGPIPMTIARIGKLQGLYLQDNKLQGPVPEDICNLPSLAFLSLSSNKLDGSIPLCIGNLTSLGELYLGSNWLMGTIPDSLWSLNNIMVLNMSMNFLRGNLASGVGNLKAVILLDLSGNQLSGKVPNSIENLQNMLNFSLSHNMFQGDIPEPFGKMVSLESLDLSSNNLTGLIPKSLELLSYLKYLNLSFNHLSGEIPSGGPFANFLAQSFIGNEALCGDPRLRVPPCPVPAIHRPQTTKSRLLRILLPSILSAILALGLLFVLARYLRRNRKLSTEDASMTFASRRRISYYEVLQATNGLSPSNLLGVGCFGSVYKGTLSDGLSIAVKVFDLELEGALKSFEAECEVLRNIRHRNLVKIISSCCNLDFRALILEHMLNGSLERWIHGDGYYLDILRRLDIMIDIAYGLEYLHEGYSIPIVHCDLKPSNVLLGEDLVACLGDFGISKLLGEENSMTRTKTLATIGYMAPEYGSGGFVSTRGDVYSYGILLMETFTGKRPTDEMFSAEESLKHWVKKSLPHAVPDVLDTNLLSREELTAAKLDCLSSILELAVHCCAESPEERMRMHDVLARLNKIKTVLEHVR